MKFIKAITLAIATMFILANTATAQSKILVLDYNKVINDSQAGKSVRSQLKTIVKSMENEVKNKVKRLETEGKGIQASTKGLTMADLKSRPDLTQKIKSFGAKQQKTQLDVKYKDAELQKTEGKALAQINKKIKTIIDAVARERGADIVVEKRGSTYYSSASIDITATIISRLNSQLPKVTVVRERIARKTQ